MAGYGAGPSRFQGSRRRIHDRPRPMKFGLDGASDNPLVAFPVGERAMHDDETPVRIAHPTSSWDASRFAASKPPLARDVRVRPRRTQEHSRHRAVPAHQGRPSRHPALLPDGRLLRAVLRRRPPRLEAARHRAHCAGAVGRGSDPDGGSAGAFGRVVSRQAGAQGRVGRDLRADRRPGDGARSGGTAGHPNHHARDADRRAPARGTPRQPARGGPLRCRMLGHRGSRTLQRQVHLHGSRRRRERSSGARTAWSGRDPSM